VTPDHQDAQSGRHGGGCEAAKAGPLIREARLPGGDMSARRLGTALTDHATILARAKAAVARIEAGMA
jgi:hypothetical protein